MIYSEAKAILRDAIGPPQAELDFESRLRASPGRLSPMDSSTAGKLPEEDSYSDPILRALLVVRREIAGQNMVEHDLIGILVLLDLPIRMLATKPEYSDTRIPQISIIMDAICMTNLVADVDRKSKAK